jgi:hypothetical protein
MRQRPHNHAVEYHLIQTGMLLIIIKPSNLQISVMRFILFRIKPSDRKLFDFTFSCALITCFHPEYMQRIPSHYLLLTRCVVKVWMGQKHVPSIGVLHKHVAVFSLINKLLVLLTNRGRKFKNVWAILEYFRCMFGNTAETWSYCNLGSGGDMMRVWFRCLSVPCKHDVNKTAPLEIWTKDKQCVKVRILVSEGMKGAQTHGQLAARLWSEMFYTVRCIRVYRNA